MSANRSWWGQRQERRRVRPYVKQLDADEPADRLAAAEELRKLGPDAAPASDALVAHLSDPNWAVRAEAEKALTAIGAAAVDALVRRLGSGDGHARVQAAELLEALGPRARPAVPALRQAIDASDASVRVALQRALRKIEH